MAGGPIRLGLVGEGIGASRTPAMHEAEARAQGIDLRYDLIDTAALPPPERDLGPLLARLRAEGYAGINVTHPFKQAVLAHLDAASPEVGRIGAANTVLFADGRLIGHNTDHWGFARSLAEGLPGAPMAEVLLLGAGGAGAAMAPALLAHGAGRLWLHDARAEAAAALAARLTAAFGPGCAALTADPGAQAAGVDGIVNATPMGMAAHPGLPLPDAALLARHWVAEAVYFPLETALLRLARDRGCRTLDGSGMAVFQAVRAFELFTGRPADPRRMRATFDSF